MFCFACTMFCFALLCCFDVFVMLCLLLVYVCVWILCCCVLSRAVAFGFVLCIVMLYYVFVYLRVGSVLVFLFAICGVRWRFASGICWRVAFVVGGGAFRWRLFVCLCNDFGMLCSCVCVGVSGDVFCVFRPGACCLLVCLSGGVSCVGVSCPWVRCALACFVRGESSFGMWCPVVCPEERAQS